MLMYYCYVCSVLGILIHYVLCIFLCVTVYCTALYCAVLYCTVLYCTVLYCTVLYCTVLCTSDSGCHWCTVQYSTQQLVFALPVKSLAFHKTQRLITVLTKAYRLFPPWSTSHLISVQPAWPSGFHFSFRRDVFRGLVSPFIDLHFKFPAVVCVCVCVHF